MRFVLGALTEQVSRAFGSVQSPSTPQYFLGKRVRPNCLCPAFLARLKPTPRSSAPTGGCLFQAVFPITHISSFCPAFPVWHVIWLECQSYSCDQLVWKGTGRGVFSVD